MQLYTPVMSRQVVPAPSLGWFRFGLLGTSVGMVLSLVVPIGFVAMMLASGAGSQTSVRIGMAVAGLVALLLLGGAPLMAFTLPAGAPPRKMAIWAVLPMLVCVAAVGWAVASAAGATSSMDYSLQESIEQVVGVAGSIASGIALLLVALTLRATGRWFNHPATVGISGFSALCSIGISLLALASLVLDNMVSGNGFSAYQAREANSIMTVAIGVPLSVGLLVSLTVGGVCAWRATHGNPLPDDAPRRSGAWVWAFGAAVITVGLTGGVAWVVLGPMHYDKALYDGIRAEFRCDIDPAENAWHTYLSGEQLEVAELDYQQEQEILDALGDINGQRRPDLSPFKQMLAGETGAMALWDRALRQPEGHGDIPLDELDASTEIPISQWLVQMTKLRLMADLDDPTRFAKTVHAIRHAVCTLSNHGSLVDSAIACVIAKIAFDYIAAHLTMCRDRITQDHRRQLQDDLAGMATSGRTGLDSVIGEFYWQKRNPLPIEDASPLQQIYYNSMTSRRARAGEWILRNALANREMDNATWHRHRFRGDANEAVMAALTTWEKVRCGPTLVLLSVAIPIYQGLIVQIRCVNTRARELQLALRIEEYAAAHDGKLPGSLDELWAGDLVRDDWRSDGSAYRYEVLPAGGCDAGYRIGSYGDSDEWPGWPDNDACVVVPPRQR